MSVLHSLASQGNRRNATADGKHQDFCAAHGMLMVICTLSCGTGVKGFWADYINIFAVRSCQDVKTESVAHSTFAS
jgi:hypothetical protein